MNLLQNAHIVARTVIARDAYECEGLKRFMPSIPSLFSFFSVLLTKYFSSIFSFLVLINDLPFLMKQPPKKEISEENQISYACDVVRLLLPWLRKLRQEQMEEKKLEAKIKGSVFWTSIVVCHKLVSEIAVHANLFLLQVFWLMI